MGSLDSESSYVQSTLAAYGNDLLSLGVDGLRLDAAKSWLILLSYKKLSVNFDCRHQCYKFTSDR